MTRRPYEPPTCTKVDVETLIRALRVDQLLYEPQSLRGPAVARIGDEAALLLDVAEGRATLDDLEVLVPEDFAAPGFRTIYLFAVEWMRDGRAMAFDLFSAAFAERWGLTDSRLARLFKPILDGPDLFVPSPREKAFSLHRVGVLRRRLAACERVDLIARAAAQTADSVDVESYLADLSAATGGER